MLSIAVADSLLQWHGQRDCCTLDPLDDEEIYLLRCHGCLGVWSLVGGRFGNSLVMGGFSWCNETSHLLCDRLSRSVGRIAIYIYLERVRVAALDVT